MLKNFMAFLSMVWSIIALGEVSVVGVTAQQRYPWNGVVDIEVKLLGTAKELSGLECVFAATNVAASTALAMAHIEKDGEDIQAGGTWTRHFVWDAKEDVGAIKIDEVDVIVDIEPSGVQLWEEGPFWAKCNVGAAKPEEYGYYFWWGDTVGYRVDTSDALWSRSLDEDWPGDMWSGVTWVSSIDGLINLSPFSPSNVVTCNKNYEQLKSMGYVDARGYLTAEHDAATLHLGEPWRMPTLTEFRYLEEKCDKTWLIRNGVFGCLFTGRGAYSMNSIFLPAAGCGNDFNLHSSGLTGGYWIATANDAFPADYARGFFFNSINGYCSNSSSARYHGLPVRPVRVSVNERPTALTKSFSISLDCREGVRIAGETEYIKFSPTWKSVDNDAESVVAINGVEVLCSSESGVYEWTPTEDGVYRLNHVVMVNGKRVGNRLEAWFVVGDVSTPLVDAEGCLFEYYGEIPEVLRIPGNVKKIAAGVFENSDSIKSVALPCSVSEIDASAFKECNSLTTLKWEACAKVAMPGFLEAVFPNMPSFDDNNDIKADAISTKLAAEVLTAADTPEYTMYGYAAYMWFDGGVAYEFQAGYDDRASIKVDGDYLIYASSRDCVTQSALKRYDESGWHWIELRGWNGGGAGATNNGANPGMHWRKQGESEWRLFEDSGDGALFRVGERAVGIKEVFNDSPIEYIELGSQVKAITPRLFAGFDTLKEIFIPSSVIKIDGSAFEGCDNLCTIYADVGDIQRIRELLRGSGVDISHISFIDSEYVLFEPVTVKSISAEQRYPWNGKVDIFVEMQGRAEDVAEYQCRFSAIDVGIKNSIELKHIEQNGDDTFDGYVWTRHFVWDASADVGETIIEDVKLATGDLSADQANSIETHLALDTRKGVRVACMTEALLFSTIWEGGQEGAIVEISVNGEVVKRASGSGKFEWTPIEDGWYTLTHTVKFADGQIGEPLEATFQVSHISGLVVNAEGEIVGTNEHLPEELIIPSRVTAIGANAFLNCTSLKSITIPNSVKTVGNRAFCGCSSLASITIPDSVNTVGGDALLGCDSLKEIVGWRTGFPSNVVRVVISNRVTEINASAFSNCDLLKSITIPESVKIIESGAFDGSPNVDWEYRSGYKYVDGWLIGYTKDAAEEIPDVDSIRGIANGALDGCGALRRFVCTNQALLKRIPQKAFADCGKLKEVTLPEGLEVIGDEAFIGCSDVRNFVIPGHVTSIGNRAFAYCSNLTNAQIAYGVRSIGEEAFLDCWQISDVDIPSTVYSVGRDAFGGDSSIIRASMRGDICKIMDVFSNYQHIREFIVKPGLLALKDRLFAGCSELKDVRMIGDCPVMQNDGIYLYENAGTAINQETGLKIELTTYVTEGSLGWNGRPNSAALPQSWPLSGSYRRSIAFWDVPTYLCKFDANGGTLGVQDTYQYSEKKVVLPPEPVQSGYVFAGWWTQPTGGLRVTEDTIFIEGVYTYLWAHWVKGHWVFLNPNGGECINEFVTYVDQSVYGVLPTPVKSGYSFGGWLYNGYVVEPETQLHEKADHTLIAQWTANKYKVQYHPNGGVGELVNEDWVYGETKTLRRNAFSRVGYDFVGWSMSPTATIAQYKDKERISNLTTKAGEVVVLYAVWEKSAAVDPTNVVFTNGGDADWQQLSQLVAKDDGTHSVATPVVWQSGKIGDNESSVLKTKVCGKGMISFWWRVSCESFRTMKLDHLAFAVDGEEIRWINGDKDWMYFEAEITSGGEHEVVWSYNKDDEGSDGEDCGAVCAVVWTPQLSNLSDYLNADDLTITTTGATDWFGTTEVSHDGAGAAQSGKIGDNQESRLETTVDGSGTIAFWWKVDCESYRTYKLDHVAFLIDGVEQKWINGNKDWMRESFEVSGAGAHTLAWVYAKDEEGSDGEDCAWVDEIVWSPAPKPSRPEIIEGASEEVKVAFDQWVADYSVSNPSAVNVNAFILGLEPSATKEVIQEKVEEELANLDLGKLAEEDISAAVAEIQAKYPNAKVDLAPVEDLNTSAHLYKLVIKLK